MVPHSNASSVIQSTREMNDEQSHRGELADQSGSAQKHMSGNPTTQELSEQTAMVAISPVING